MARRADKAWRSVAEAGSPALKANDVEAWLQEQLRRHREYRDYLFRKTGRSMEELCANRGQVSQATRALPMPATALATEERSRLELIREWNEFEQHRRYYDTIGATWRH